MTVIKRHEVVPLGHDNAVVLDLGDLRRQGQEIIAEARAEGERMVAAARAEAETAGVQLRAEAEEAGRADGLAAGRAEGLAAGTAEAKADCAARLEAITEAWEMTLAAWDGQRETDLAEARRDLVDLAVAIAARVVRRSIAGDASLVVDQVNGVLDLVAAGRDVRLRLHPEDVELIEATSADLLTRVRATRHLDLAADPDIDRGGLLMETGEGIVDARLGVQLDRIAEALVPGRSDAARRPAATDEAAADLATADLAAADEADGDASNGDALDGDASDGDAADRAGDEAAADDEQWGTAA